jgi:hypothetical protein
MMSSFMVAFITADDQSISKHIVTQARFTLPIDNFFKVRQASSRDRVFKLIQLRLEKALRIVS